MIGTTVVGPRRCLRSSCYYDTLSFFFRVELHRCGNLQGPRHTWKDPCGGCELADRLVSISPAAPNQRPLRARNRNVQQGSSPLTAVEASTSSSSAPGASYADAKLTRCLHKRQVGGTFSKPLSLAKPLHRVSYEDRDSSTSSPRSCQMFVLDARREVRFTLLGCIHCPCRLSSGSPSLQFCEEKVSRRVCQEKRLAEVQRYSLCLLCGSFAEKG